MARQSIQFNGKTWVRDGSWWVDAEALAPYGGDPDAAPPEIVEGNRVKYREGLQLKTSESRGNPHGGQKAYRGGLQNDYGREAGNRIFDQHVAWARDAEAMGASPEMVDFLYFQEGVMLPGGLIADYTTGKDGQGVVRIVDLQGNPVPVTPELEQQTRAEHIKVYGDKYRDGGSQPSAPPSAPPAAPPPGTTSTVSAPQMPGPITRPAPPAPPAQAPAPGATPPPGQQGGGGSTGLNNGRELPASPLPPGRSPYPGTGTGALRGPQPPSQQPPRLSEQPGLGGAAAPAPTSATQPAAGSTTPPGQGKPAGNVSPVKPGLGTAGTPVQPGLGAPVQPPQPPAGAPGQGGAGAAVPPAAPPPARSPYPQSPAVPLAAAAPPSPYPGMQPRPPRTVALPGSLANYGVPMPTLSEGQHFFDPFSGKWV